MYFVHSVGLIIGTAFEWEQFSFDLTMMSGIAIVFSEHSLAPEKQFRVLQHILQHGTDHSLECDKL